MDAKTHARYEARAGVIKALAHPTRLFIVDELARTGEKCVCELTAMIGADISTVSKHLTILKGVGLVQDEKRGSMVYYHLGMPCVLNFFECVESLVTIRAEQQRQACGLLR